MVISILDRKLLRDLARIWAQSLAIALVMACGVMTIIIAVGAWRSLEETRSALYDRYRFAHVFSTATRAPLHLQSRIEAIPGVALASPRIAKPVLLDMTGMAEPATGIAISIPDLHEIRVNRLYLRTGRLPAAGRPNEAAVIETFAEAHGLKPGDTFKALMNGKKRELLITGIVLSPEYVYAIGPGDMVPDQRRFGVFYMSEQALGAIFDLEGSFNSIGLTMLRNADEDRIVEELDTILKPYGGSGAHGRDDQVSNAFLDSELTQLEGMAKVIPPIFLFISAFLVNMIMSRLIALEREQIGLLKAVGYSGTAIGWHYAKLVIAIALVGLIVGSVAGNYLGQGLTRLYASFYSFPFLIFRRSVDLYLIAGGVTVFAALAGAAKAIWTTLALEPAVSMRPPAPTRYKSFLPWHVLPPRLISQLTVMALRHLIRWPVRSGLTTLGISLSVSLLLAALFSYDSIDAMIDSIFFKAERQDATLVFGSDVGPSAVAATYALPGVLRVEPYRGTAVTLRHGYKEKQLSITGVPENPVLSRILDMDLEPMEPPRNGLVVSERVAALLDLKPGDMVEAQLRERNDRLVHLPIAGISQSYVGLSAHMNIEALNQLMLQGRRVNGVKIKIDHRQVDELYSAVKETPGVAAIALLGVSRAQFRDIVEQNITTMTAVYIALAVIITFGVVYNSARIQLSERARELASLRVFGFTRAEVASVLVIELAIIVLLAQPLGWLLGYGFALSVIQGFESDIFRLPLVIHDATYALSSLVVVGAAIVSTAIVVRRVARLDLVRVLKSRE